MWNVQKPTSGPLTLLRFLRLAQFDAADVLAVCRERLKEAELTFD